MADLHNEPTRPKARKRHRCIFCYGPIVAGEQYVQQSGFYDGAPYRNKYHAECWTELEAEGPWFEFTPGEGDWPERVRAAQTGGEHG